ncbi:putative chaperone protein EcpD [compost metagenome]
MLECNNSTPYNVSFSDVRLKGSAPKKSITKGGMCPAKGHETFPVHGTPRADGKLVFTAINDYGGFTEREADYSH